jgi:hypothetical protein
MESKGIQIEIITQNMKNNIFSSQIINKYLKKINNFDILIEFTQEDNRKYIQFPFYLMAYGFNNENQKNNYKLIADETLLERPSEMNIGISIYSNNLYPIQVLAVGKIPLPAAEYGIKQIGYKIGYYTKGCVYIKIKIGNKNNEKILLLCSVHLPTDKYDGITNLKFLLKKINEISSDCDSIFLGGDFNFKIEKNGTDIFDKILKKSILENFEEPIDAKGLNIYTYKFNLYDSNAKSEEKSKYKLNSWSNKFYGYPFQKITDENGNDTKVIALSAPLYKKDREIFYKLEKKGYKFIGISSYGYFPIYSKEDSKYDSRAEELKMPDMQNILNKMSGWLYCNQDPTFLLNIPKLLFSESDIPFIDNVKIKNLKKEYDIIYNAGSDAEFHKYHKNWILAKKCFKKMVENNLRILIIGREKMDDPSEEHPNIVLKPFTPYYDFLDYIEKSKVCFVPNVSDASPRVITESLIKGVPVIVNKNIFGGWKYVCSKTGKFFEDENDIIKKINKIIMKVDEGKYNTRKWFIKNYYIDNGTEKVSISGINLKNFIDKILNKQNLKSYIKSRLNIDGFKDAIYDKNILSKCDRILYSNKNLDILINMYETKVLMLNSDHNAQTINFTIFDKKIKD